MSFYIIKFYSVENINGRTKWISTHLSVKLYVVVIIIC